MPVKLTIKVITAKNKKVSTKKLSSGRALLKGMRKLAKERRTYNLVSPYSRKASIEPTSSVAVL